MIRAIGIAVSSSGSAPVKYFEGDTRIFMECTGRYSEPIARKLPQADFFVNCVNPQIIHNFQGQGNPLRKVKTDKADS